MPDLMFPNRRLAGLSDVLLTSLTTGDVLAWNGTYWVNQIAGLTGEQVDDRVAGLLVAGTNITLDYDDGANTLTVNASGDGLTQEQIEDFLAGAFVSGCNTAIVYDDAANSFTWHERWLFVADTAAATITLDLAEDVGLSHEPVIDQDTAFQVTNADINGETGKHWRLVVTQDEVGGHAISFVFPIVWRDGFFPAHALNPGKSTAFEFLVRSLDVYGVPTCEAWVETDMLPKLASDSSTTTTLDGVTWVPRTPAAASFWSSVAFGNGLFVAVANIGAPVNERVMTSPDGVTWTIRDSTGGDYWKSIVYGNGLFVVVGLHGNSGQRVMSSPDGLTWTLRPNSPVDVTWNSVTYGNGLFVAVSSSGSGNDRVMTSPDGIDWTLRTSANGNDWQAVAYGNGLFVAVANTGGSGRVMTSPDGITWTARTSPLNNWSSVTYGNGLFVAVGTSGTGNRVMTSPDGITWTSRTSAADKNWLGVAWGGGLFAAVADHFSNAVMTSVDGITWMLGVTSGHDWDAIVYGAGKMVAVAGYYGGSSEDERVMTSSSGVAADAATVDWSTTDSAMVPLTAGNGEFAIDQLNLIAGKSVFLTIDNAAGATGTLSFVMPAGVTLDWRGVPPLTAVPDAGETYELEFHAVSLTRVIVQVW